MYKQKRRSSSWKSFREVSDSTVLAEVYPSGCSSGVKACAKRMPRHCHDVIEMKPTATSGVYLISPNGNGHDPFKVWCDSSIG